MKRWLRISLVLFLVLAAALAALLFFARGAVGRQAQTQLAAALSQAAGVPVRLSNAELDLSEWFRLKPAIRIDNLELANPPGYPASPLMVAQQVSARVSLWPLLQRNLQVHSLEVRHPRVAIAFGAGGVTNLEAFLKRVSEPKSEAPAPAASGKKDEALALTVDELRITSGEVILPDGKAALRDINIRLTEFSAGKAALLALETGLFGSGSSRLKLDGRVGPFGANALPVDGKLALSILPADVPLALRKEQMGGLLNHPGRDARVALDATVKGDAYGKLAGPARLAFRNIQIGPDPKKLLRLAGDAPIWFSATHLVSDPAFDLNLQKGRLSLGRGEWSGSARLQLRGRIMSGSSSGDLRNVDVNEILSSFGGTPDKIFGALAVPAYSLKFAGRNAAEIERSLTGTGKVAIGEGRITALDFLGTIEKALAKPQAEGTNAAGTTPFTTLGANLSLADRKVNLADISLGSPLLGLTGNGSIGLDKSLAFELRAKLTGSATQLVNRFALRLTGSETVIPLSVAGTVDAPRIRPRVGSFVGETAKGLVGSFLQRALTRQAKPAEEAKPAEPPKK